MKRKISILSLLFLLPATLALAGEDIRYKIQDIWTDIPHEGCCPTLSEAYAINDAGYVGGRLAEFPGEFGSPFIWKNGTFILNGGIGGRFGAVVDINNSNQAVGHVLGGSPYRDATGFYIENGTITKIPYFYPRSIDEDGKAYGHLEKREPPQIYPFFVTWENGGFGPAGTNPKAEIPIPAIDFSKPEKILLRGSDPLWHTLIPKDVNISGQIVGFGLYGVGETANPIRNRAFIMTPVVTPEPASSALFLLGAGGLAFIRRNRK